MVLLWPLHTWFDGEFGIAMAVPILLTILIIGNRQHALAILAHDGAHGHAPRWMTKLLFWSIGVNLDRYRQFHFDHHKYLGTPKDPELPYRSEAWDKFAWRNVWRDLCGLNGLEMLRVWKAAGGSFVIMGATLAVLASLSPMFALLWIVALNTSFVACFRQRAISDYEAHNGNERPPIWWQRMLFLPHNSWAHKQHHDDPALSFNRVNPG